MEEEIEENERDNKQNSDYVHLMTSSSPAAFQELRAHLEQFVGSTLPSALCKSPGR